jgi:hypothetical protein
LEEEEEYAREEADIEDEIERKREIIDREKEILFR